MKNQILLFCSLVFLCCTFNASTQCYPDRHNTSWYNGWASCEQTESPNLTRGKSHWIMYDLKRNYQLGKTHIWNTNDPKNLNWGFNNVVIDVSKDGENWIEVGAFFWEMAPGINNYEGSEGPDLLGYEGQFMLITALSNHGGECYGFSEIRIEAESDGIISSVEDGRKNDCFVMAAFPNPFVDQVRIEIKAECFGELQYSITDVLGHTIESGEHSIRTGQNILPIRLGDIPAGTYILSVRQGQYQSQMTLVKM